MRLEHYLNPVSNQKYELITLLEIRIINPISLKVLENFDKQCSSCGECKFNENNGDKSLGGGNHTLEQCIDACQKKADCFFASLNTQGYCHMTKKCHETEGAGWTRYKKLSEQGFKNLNLMLMTIYLKKINETWNIKISYLIQQFITYFCRGYT